jgi:hypothetical protein
MDGTSRVTGDCQARFCERLGVKFPGATRRAGPTGIPTATGGLTGCPLGPACREVLRLLALG